jgi:translocation and assembly module TamB
MGRAWRTGAWVAGIALGLCVVLVAAVLVLGRSAGGRSLIERLTNRVAPGTLHVSGLAGSLPSEVRLERLELRDARGVWLTAEQLSLHWSPLTLLTKRIHIADLEAARVALERLPASEPSAAPESGGLHLPHIDAERVNIGVLEIGPELAGSRTRLTVRASLRMRSLEDAAVTLNAHRTDAQHDRYELRLQFDPSRVDAHLLIDEQPGGVLQNLLHLPDLGALQAAGELQGPRSTAHLALTARAGSLESHAHGSLDLVRRTADVELALHAPALSPRPDLAWQHIELSGRAHGAWSAPDAHAQLLIEALRTPGDIWVERLRAELRAQGGAMSVQADAEGVTLPGSYAGLLRDAPVHVEASTRLDDPQRALTLRASQRLFVLEAQAALAAAPVAKFALRLTDLAPLGALIGEPLHGTATIDGTAKSGVEGSAAELEARAELQGASQLTRLLGPTPRLQASLRLDGRQTTLSRLMLTAAAATLSGSGSLTAQGDATSPARPPLVSGDWTLSMTDLAVLGSALAGTLTAQGGMRGPLDAFGADLQATASLSVHGSALGTIRASLKARNLPAAPSVTIGVEGSLDGAPLWLDVGAERGRDRALRVAVSRAQWKSAQATAQLTIPEALKHSTGTARLRIGQLGDLDRLLGVDLAGSLHGELALTRVRGASTTHLELRAEDVVFGGVSANATLSASGSPAAPSVNATVQVPELSGSPATLKAAGQLNLDHRQLRLSELTATWRRQSPHLLSPAQISFAQGLSVSGLEIGLRRAVLALDGELSPELNLRASLRGVDPAVVNTVMPDLLSQGAITGDAELTGTPAAPRGHVRIKAVNLHLADPSVRDLAGIDVAAAAQLEGERAQLDAHLEGGASARVTLVGEAPLNDTGSYDVKLAGTLNLGLANALLESHGAHAAGLIEADLHVGGTRRDPQIGGTVKITHGALRDYRLGTNLTDIDGLLEGDRGTLHIRQLTARAPPGQLTITGSVGVMQPKLPIDLQLLAQNATPISSDLLTARLDADLRFTGALDERSDLAGTIAIKRADINIPDTFPPNVAVLDVRRRGQAPPPAAKRSAVIGLDLTLSAPRQILVQGRGLTAELGGELRIRGTTDAPRVRGGFDLIRGRIALASATLNFTTGRVSFDSSGLQGKIDPSLDFVAQTSTADGTATLRVTGFADAPQFVLSSSPPLPQDEILSRLLFGQSASSLSSIQAAQLGHALATYSGLGGGFDVLGRLQRSLGLDVLTLGSMTTGTGSQQNTSVTVQAGRYVSDRVLVTGRESEFGTQVGVDVDLSKHMKLTTRLGNSNAGAAQGITPENDPGSSVGISYQFEY